jgi:lysophospholipase L1-like esterase
LESDSKIYSSSDLPPYRFLKLIKINSKKIIFSIAIIIIFFGAIELTLYLQDFNYSRFPRIAKQNFVNKRLKHGFADEQQILQAFVPHKTRMWTAKPDGPGVNAKGYVGKEIKLEKDPSSKRILFVGDSCSIRENYYPGKTIEKLKSKLGISLEPLIAAVAGYSSYQVMLFLEDSLKYKPDAIVAYFGWNDHWIAGHGGPDHEYKKIKNFELITFNLFSKLRFYQLLHYMIYPPKKINISNNGKEKQIDLLRILRVPPEFYAKNIIRMIEMAKANKIKIYFIKAPIGSHIVKNKWNSFFPMEHIFYVHKLYNSILEEMVSKHSHAFLVKLDNFVFNKELMQQDGIHPKDKGHQIIAEVLTDKIIKTDGFNLK